MPDTIKLLNISWADFKTNKTRDSFDIYYVESTNSTQAIGVTSNWTYYVQVSGSDLTDFNSNFKSAATAVPSIDDAIATANIRETIDVNIISNEDPPIQPIPETPGGMIWLYNRFRTPTGGAEATAISHTVATGKTFYLLYYVVHYGDNSDGITGDIRIKVNGATRDAAYFVTGLASGGYLQYTDLLSYYAMSPLPFADSGDTITMTISLTSSDRRRYYFTLYGFEAEP